jgi:hypothetical protein
MRCDLLATVTRNQTMHDFPDPPAAAGFSLRKILPSLIGAIAGGVFTFVALKLAKASGFAPDGAAKALFLAGIVLGLLPSLIIHELGHAAVGVWNGMRLLSLGIGPLKFTADSNGKLSREWIGGARAFAGYAMLVPPRDFAAWRMAMFAFAGPLTNFVQAALCFGLAALSPAWLAALLHGVAVSATLLGVINLLPLEIGGLQTDGKQVLDLSKGGESVRLRMAMIAAISESMRGVAPWQLDRSEFADFIHKGTHPARFALEMYTYAAERHAGDAAADATLRRLAEAYDKMPAGFREGMAAQIATSLYLHGGEIDLAKRWHAAAKGGIYGDSERELANAALALATNDAAGARTAIVASRKGNSKTYDQGWLKFTEWQLQLIENRLGA